MPCCQHLQLRMSPASSFSSTGSASFAISTLFSESRGLPLKGPKLREAKHCAHHVPRENLKNFQSHMPGDPASAEAVQVLRRSHGSHGSHLRTSIRSLPLPASNEKAAKTCLEWRNATSRIHFVSCPCQRSVKHLCHRVIKHLHALCSRT